MYIHHPSRKLFPQSVPLTPTPGPHGLEGSPDLQVQHHLPPVVLVSVCLDAVDPGALEEMPGGEVSRGLAAQAATAPSQPWVLSTASNMTLHSWDEAQTQKSNPQPLSTFITPILPALECVPLCLSYHLLCTRRWPGEKARNKVTTPALMGSQPSKGDSGGCGGEGGLHYHMGI